MLVSDILWALVGGTVVGLLGTLLTSRDHGQLRDPVEVDAVPLWLSILCGVGGVALGNAAYTHIWAPSTPGLDWWRHGWQVAGALLLVGAAALVTVGRRRRR